MSNQPYPPDPRMQPGYQEPPNQAPYGVANNTVRSSSGDGMQVQSQRESYVDPAGNRIENHSEVYEDENLRRTNRSYWIAESCTSCWLCWKSFYSCASFSACWARVRAAALSCFCTT